MAASSSADVPDAYRLFELKAGLLRLAAPPCDGELLLFVVGTQTGIEVSRVRCTSAAAGAVPAFPLDRAYQATVAAFLDTVVAALDSLADLHAQWQEKGTWNAKVHVPVRAGLPVGVQPEYDLPNQPVRRPAALTALVPERVARLARRGYTIPDPEAVASLLQQRPALGDVLRVAPAALADYFPTATRTLVVEQDELVLLVGSADPAAGAALDRFDSAWQALALPGSEWLLIDLAGGGARPAVPGAAAA